MIKPLAGLVLIEEFKEEEKTTKGGLVLAPTFSSSGPKSGKVIAMGNGEQNALNGELIKIIGFEVGDTVFYQDHTGTDIEDDNGDKFLLIHYKHIMAKKNV